MTDGTGPGAPRVLLGHLGKKGDCLYASAVARQIKADLPRSHLTWAVGSPCRSIVEGNPYVDAIWEVEMGGRYDMDETWYRFEAEALRRRDAGEFDQIYFTQVPPAQFQNYDGTVRASIFRGYPRPITVPVNPIVRLDESEVERVREFVTANRLGDYENVVLFECSSASGQSFVTTEIGLEVARQIVDGRDDTCVVMSSDIEIGAGDPRIVDASSVSFLGNAELVKSCNLLIGCSSGISWLCTSDWAEMPPTIQLLKKETSVFASFVHDHEYQGLDTSGIIEMTDCPAERIADCATTALQDSFAAARQRFHQTIPLNFNYYGKTFRMLMRRREFATAWGSVRVTAERYGWQPRLIKSLVRAMLRFT